MKNVIIVVFIVFFATSSPAAVLFEDNFDSQVDWQPRPATGDVSPGGALASCDYGDNCTGTVPTGWSNYRSDGLWWGPTYEDTIRVNSENHRGSSGKAYTQWNESNSGSSGDGWGADGILLKLFSDRQEVYVQFWMKINEPFVWRKDTNYKQDAEDMLKIMYVAHFDNTGSLFSFFTNGNSAPIYQFDLKNSHDWGWRQMHSYRCDPQSTNYYCADPADDPYFGDSNTNPDDSGQPEDGQWHCYTFHLKMNTYVGGGSWNSDGVLEFWYDTDSKTDIPLFSITDKQWIVSGTDTSIGWNTFAIGGNAYNSYAAESTHSEQGYSIDDVVVSTGALGIEPVTIILPPTNVDASTIE